MVGFLEIKEKVGWIVKPANLVVDKKEKKEKVIQLVVPLWLCVILVKNIKRGLKEFLGKKEIKLNKPLLFFYEL
jgi:hypothetical protein